MLQFLLEGGFAPFTLALALLTGLMVLELVALLLGGSLIGSDGDADLDLDAGEVGDFDLDLDGADLGGVEGIDAADLDLPDADLELAPDTPVDAGASASAGLAGWLGLGRMPMVIWLGAVLLGFGLLGMGLQVALSSTLGLTAPAWVAAIPAGGFAFWFARVFGGGFARVLPQTETEVLSERNLGRRRGIVTQGTAASGRPAEVRVIDGYGNAHYLRAEPLKEGETIAQGTEVLVIRDRRKGSYVLVAVSE
ncbi:OB-fold-containig protein [Phycobacter azelaicus]|uniref:OB-fold-containig protein n=1 Tax=Phycobacter azelaicus TaxID=2668075 RepID=UPI0018670C4D|nr:OB-fold-containig protein [Phycobacter azelaicus]